VRGGPKEVKTRTAPGTGKILLVEDEDGVRRLTARVLTGCGYEVVDMASPAAALALFQGSRPHFDLLITDVVMPGLHFLGKPFTGTTLSHKVKEVLATI